MLHFSICLVTSPRYTTSVTFLHLNPKKNALETKKMLQIVDFTTNLIWKVFCSEKTISRFLTLSHVFGLFRTSISWFLMQCMYTSRCEYNVQCHLTLSHAISRFLTPSHAISCYLTLSHASSRDPGIAWASVRECEIAWDNIARDPRSQLRAHRSQYLMLSHAISR